MEGIVLHAKYCFMPNKLGGCGIQTKTSDLFEYASQEVSDTGLTEILKTFEAAYPYLQFIARNSSIEDPFDKRVVEAYWIGNDLLQKIDKKKFYDWCFDRYGKQANPKTLKLLVGTIPMGALPHHSFHVFNSYLRNKHFDKVLSFMNDCRITSAEVKEIKATTLKVEYLPVIYGLRGFDFGEKIEKTVYFKIGDKSFVDDLKVGDKVSVHWNWVCDRLSLEQSKSLENTTLQQLKLFNNFL